MLLRLCPHDTDYLSAYGLPHSSENQFVENMKPLNIPDIHHLRAAVGWLELGNHLEANAELENITTAFTAAPPTGSAIPPMPAELKTEVGTA
jgi:hypothetical protein